MKISSVICTLAVLLLAGGCEESDDLINGFQPASSFSTKGFAKNAKQARQWNGKKIKVWGWVDYSNVFPNGEKNPVNPANHWRLNVKAKATDKVGESFAVYIPIDARRDALVARIRAQEKTGQPIRIFVTGTVTWFAARGNFSQRTGLILKATQPIQLDAGQ